MNPAADSAGHASAPPSLPPLPRKLLSPRYWPTWAGLGFLRGLSLLPMPLLWLLGLALGQVALLFPSRAKRTVKINLRLSFPHLRPRERRRLRRMHFRRLGQLALTVGVAQWASASRLKRLVKFRDRHHYDAALTAKRSIILLAPHFLALDVAGMRLSQERPMMSMYKESKNSLVDWVMRRARSRFGGVMIERNAELRPMIRMLREGKPFYYLPDQEPGDAEFVFAPFFGIPTATLTALGRMARLADAVVIPVCTRFLPFGRGYEAVFYPPLDDFPSKDSAADAARMNAAIEAGVREMPDQYMWTYKRFKRRPPGEPSLYT